MRILAVDDEATVRELLEDFLKAKGYEVETVADGPAALAAVGSRSFDLVLVDLMMPGMTGMEVLRRLRSQDAALPIVVITAVTDEDVGRAALREGANDYLTKPIDLAHLERVVTASVLPGQA